MIYSPGNAAKQWIFERLHEHATGGKLSVLDCGCGDAGIWQAFLDDHPDVSLFGIDTDAARIAAAKERYRDKKNVRFDVADAQREMPSEYDAVVALSVVEHVVDRAAFARFVARALKPGGTALLNYDSGHFRSSHLKERVMVPISQVLALLGIEGSYMKEVDTRAFVKQLADAGLRVDHVRKGNIHPLKGFFRNATPAALKAWFGFEDALNEAYPPKELDKLMWSTTIVAEKV